MSSIFANNSTKQRFIKSYYERVTSPRWQHRSFLILHPSQEEQETSIQEQDTTERILGQNGEAEVAPYTSETRTECIGRVREAATC